MRRGPEKTTIWWFKCTGEEDVDYIDLKVGNDGDDGYEMEATTERITPTLRGYQRSLNSTNFKVTESPKGKGKGKKGACDKSEQAEVPPTPGAAAGAAAVTEEERSNKKRPAEDGNCATHKDAADAIMASDGEQIDLVAEQSAKVLRTASPKKMPYSDKAPKGAQIIKVRDDGPCLFDSVANFIEREKYLPQGCKKSPSHIELRRKTITHFKTEWQSTMFGTASYADIWDHQKPQKELEECPTAAEYWKLLSKDSAWASALEILALTRLLKRTILVVLWNEMTSMVYGEKFSSGKPIIIRYLNGHY